MIKKDAFVPEESSRSELVTALRGLRHGESLLIHPVGEHTRSNVYTAASRMRLSVRTKVTQFGLRVWLKGSPPKSEPIKAETREDKIAQLRAMMGDARPEPTWVKDEYSQEG